MEQTFFLSLTEQIIFLQVAEQILFLLFAEHFFHKHSLPPGIKWSAP